MQTNAKICKHTTELCKNLQNCAKIAFKPQKMAQLEKICTAGITHVTLFLHLCWSVGPSLLRGVCAVSACVSRLYSFLTTRSLLGRVVCTFSSLVLLYFYDAAKICLLSVLSGNFRSDMKTERHKIFNKTV